MSAALVIVCLGVCLAVGTWAGYQWARSDHLQEIRRLKGTIQENAKALKSAQVDTELVRALRKGEIGVADLHEVGFENVCQEVPGAFEGVFSAAPKELPEAQEEYEYQPFIPLPYRRNLDHIGQMTPGDEAWISITSVHHTPHGSPALWRNARCSSEPKKSQRCRLRRLEDGLYEIAFDPDDPDEANAQVTVAHIVPKYVTTLRYGDRWRG